MKNQCVLAILLSLMFCFTGCGMQIEDIYDENPSEIPELVTEFYAGLGITKDIQKNAKAVYVECDLKNPVKLRLPEYWEDIYVLKTDKEANSFLLCEKYAYDTKPEWNRGFVWQINIYDKVKFEAKYEKHAPNYYNQNLGENTVVIGTKDDKVYVLSLPTDMQFVHTELGRALYETAMRNQEKFITDFIETNGIKENEYRPKLSENIKLDNLEDKRSVAVSHEEIMITIGGTVDIELQIEGFVNPEVIYISKDSTIASVDENGKIKAKALGETEIYAVVHSIGEKDFMIKCINVKVELLVHTINIEPKYLTINEGQEKRIEITTFPQEAINYVEFVFELSNGECFSFDMNSCKIKGLKEGRGVLKLIYKNGNNEIEGQCIVNVEN